VWISQFLDETSGKLTVLVLLQKARWERSNAAVRGRLRVAARDAVRATASVPAAACAGGSRLVCAGPGRRRRARGTGSEASQRQWAAPVPGGGAELQCASAV